MLAVLGIAAFIAGVVVGGSLVWMGLALFAGSFIPLVVVVEVRERKIAKSRWQVGTVTFRTVEPGRVDEYGQEVVCEVTVNPTAPITRVAATIGLLDTQWLVVGATTRCVADPRPAVLPRVVLRRSPTPGTTPPSRPVAR
ncbi:hypothetical protein [Mycolicibacterium arenosum]|uniref:DUF58 domain-containing protein n=1 Tax=Mycolicibacterium arenosum TaxID=2952157 RepID=A0ABT1MCN4_9MYCO|nr:hypothetical protein [Mycolicibacterium sp. CAU 1645]MCP9276934.1 hypothetical protein [Mycolicibacterium sp. CAU 1645]